MYSVARVSARLVGTDGFALTYHFPWSSSMLSAKFLILSNSIPVTSLIPSRNTFPIYLDLPSCSAGNWHTRFFILFALLHRWRIAPTTHSAVIIPTRLHSNLSFFFNISLVLFSLTLNHVTSDLLLTKWLFDQHCVLLLRVCCWNLSAVRPLATVSFLLQLISFSGPTSRTHSPYFIWSELWTHKVGAPTWRFQYFLAIIEVDKAKMESVILELLPVTENSRLFQNVLSFLQERNEDDTDKNKIPKRRQKIYQRIRQLKNYH